MDFPDGSAVKCLPAMQETSVQSLGQEYPLEKEMATHSSTPAWKIPLTEVPGRLQSMELQNSQTWLSNYITTAAAIVNSFSDITGKLKIQI